MWLWLLIQTALLQSFIPAVEQGLPAFIPSTDAAETSVGPTSDAEAALLWRDGQAAFKTEDYVQAIVLLQRLVDRYPGAQGYLEAHRYLGRAYLFTNQADKSVAPLKYYIAATSDRALSLRARIWLGEAYLALKKPHEAYLAALEIEKSKTAGAVLFSESQILKARALVDTNEDDRAQKTLDAVKNQVVVQSDPELKVQTEQVMLELKIRECSLLPDLKKTPKMEELDTRDTYSRRALCLQEAVLLFKDAVLSGVKAKDTLTMDHSQSLLLKGFQDYNRAVLNPPAAIAVSAETPKQRAQYSAELSDVLDQDRLRTYKETLATLTSWRRLSNGWASEIYQTLITELEKLSEREK
jgi:hypothetical protein